MPKDPADLRQDRCDTQKDAIGLGKVVADTRKASAQA